MICNKKKQREKHKEESVEPEDKVENVGREIDQEIMLVNNIPEINMMVETQRNE